MSESQQYKCRNNENPTVKNDTKKQLFAMCIIERAWDIRVKVGFGGQKLPREQARRESRRSIPSWPKHSGAWGLGLRAYGLG